MKTQLRKIYFNNCKDQDFREVIEKLNNFNKNCRRLRKKKKEDSDAISAESAEETPPEPNDSPLEHSESAFTEKKTLKSTYLEDSKELEEK